MERLCRGRNKIAIVGAGPAGIYCALHILEKFSAINFSDYFLYIFDKSQALRTILATGNGRCNITNSISDIKEFSSNYPRGEKFLYSIFHRHFNCDSLEFFKKISVDTYIESDGRVFPKSNSAKDVKDKMLSALNKYKNFKIINKNISSASDLADFSHIIIACGSRGSEKLIKSFNHKCIEFKKSLCALKVADFDYPKGVSIQSKDGDFIFTSDGISGPLAFKISSINACRDFPYDIKINLVDFEDICEAIKNNPKKSIGNIFSMFLPRSFVHKIIKNFDKNASEVKKSDIISYCSLNLKIISAANAGEIVHAGGVDLDEIDKNCKSKIYKNLWFCGEVLNIDGFCGGFNLQNCWSGAYVVACDIVNNIIK